MAVDDADDYSSYDTEQSGEEDMEAEATAVGEDRGEPLKLLHTSIAAITAVQTRILEKLAAMEKQVLTVQYDMTWVRDDIKGVHNVMENIADHVCELKDATAEVEKLREQLQADASARSVGAGKGHTEDRNESAIASPEHGRNDGRDAGEAAHDPTDYEPGSYIEETQRLDTNVDMHMNIVSSPEVERENDWGHPRQASPGLCSPPCKQKRGNKVVDVVLEESQQLEMSYPNTQLRTPTSSRSMWHDFTEAVKDWPAPSTEAIGSREGWISAKRGRGLSPEYRKDRCTGGKDSNVGEQGSLNLNLSPDMTMTTELLQGRGVVAPSKNTTATNKSEGKGAGRGTARARRPPAVQPRYHSSVSFSLCPSMYYSAREARFVFGTKRNVWNIQLLCCCLNPVPSMMLVGTGSA